MDISLFLAVLLSLAIVVALLLWRAEAESAERLRLEEEQRKRAEAELAERRRLEEEQRSRAKAESAERRRLALLLLKRAAVELAEKRRAAEPAWRANTERYLHRIAAADCRDAYVLLGDYAKYVAGEFRRTVGDGAFDERLRGSDGHAKRFFQIDVDFESKHAREYSESNVTWRCLWLDDQGSIHEGYHSEYIRNGHRIDRGDQSLDLREGDLLDDWPYGRWTEQAQTVGRVMQTSGRRIYTRASNPREHSAAKIVPLLEDLLNGRSDRNIHTDWG